MSDEPPLISGKLIVPNKDGTETICNITDGFIDKPINIPTGTQIKIQLTNLENRDILMRQKSMSIGYVIKESQQEEVNND